MAGFPLHNVHIIYDAEMLANSANNLGQHHICSG